MDSDSWGQIILLVVLIIGSAFFSASETAFTSLNKIRLKTMADDGNKRAASTLRLAENYDKFLSTVLIGNNIVNIASTSIATVLFIKWLGNGPTSTTVSTVVMTVAVLIFGEVSPKSVAKEMPEKFAMFATPLFRTLVILFTPFVAFFTAWKKLLKRMFKLQNDDAITGDELLNIVEEAHSGGGIDETESDLIRSAISFSEHPVSDILTPRVDIVAVSKDEEFTEIARIFDESGFSRLPVFDETIDSIVGVIHIRDFNKLVLTGDKPLESIIKEPVFVAKQISISNLLKFMQSKKTHMAVVADEYGGTLGIATMEDILEELVGEIWDEYDEVIEEFSPLSDGSVKVLCSAQLDKLFEYFEMDEDEESESVSVGGWVLEKLGKIAEEGDSFSYENLIVTVTRVEECRVLEINISITEPSVEGEGEE
ncbi:MAG: HlyC/CorC family transporter [Ruminococcaceae bacterium]|nr:HlyC/CorC family transporter [Oscillospiraceae bacterium]